MKPQGWPGEKQRHSMSSRGIKTSRLDANLLAKGVKMHGIKNFWVVTKPGTHSVPADVLFDSDISYLLNQIRGGLNESEILGIYADPDEAREATLDTLYFHQIKDTSWEPFVKQWGISYMDLEEFATRMGYDGVGDLTVSLSPEALYKKDELRFVEEFADFGEPYAIEAERRKEPYQTALQREIEAHFSSRGVRSKKVPIPKALKKEYYNPRGMEYKVTAQSFDRQTGQPISDKRAEIIDTRTNSLFQNANTLLEVKEAYERFWNYLRPKSKEIVLVSKVVQQELR